jgi:hypothetical protein
MLTDLLIWGALLVGLCFLVVWGRGNGALTLAYFLSLSLGHVPGILSYLDPDSIQGDPEATAVGFNITLIGMTAFIVGAMAACILARRSTSVKAYQQKATANFFSRLGWRVLVMGIASYFLVLPVSALVPSATAVSSVLGTLLILGFWLQLYSAAAAHDTPRTSLVLASLPLLPLATLATGGFIGFGTIWAMSVLAFQFAIARRRIWFYLATPPIIFLGLSLFVTYYQQREDIRGVVWNETAGIMQRLDRVSTLVTDFQLFDLSNAKHLRALDERLNQNYLVGVGVMQHEAGETQLSYGSTVPLWAFIPRAIWPDKPSVGGGQELVEQFTGIKFGENTSVGAGQVLEFYMNFGMPGVLTGFTVLGFILMRLDQKVMRGLAVRNINGVIYGVLPGLALLQPLGNLLEILVAVTAAIITSLLLVHSKLLRPPPAAKMVGQTMRGSPEVWANSSRPPQNETGPLTSRPHHRTRTHSSR